MYKSGFLVWIALALAAVLVVPAMAGDFDATDIDECKIESVNQLSEKTEALATQWSGLRGTVDGIPTKIGEAAGEEVNNVEAAIEKIIALDLPITVDVAAMSVGVDKEGLSAEQQTMAAAIEQLAADLKAVPADAASVSEKAVQLGTEISAFIPGVASEFKGNPIQAAVEVPKATGILKGQIEYLTALPEEIKSTVESVGTFFEGLASAAKAAAGEAG